MEHKLSAQNSLSNNRQKPRLPGLFVRYPVIFAILLLLIYVGGIQIVAIFLKTPSFVDGLVIYTIFILLLVGFLSWSHLWHEFGFRPLKQWQQLKLLLLLLLFLVSSAGSTILLIHGQVTLATLVHGTGLPTGAYLLIYLPILLLYTAMIGFTEETIFRGLALHALLRFGWIRAALFSSLLFGLAHLNMLVPYPPQILALRALDAFLFGFFFAAIRLQMKTIWPTILAHTLFDFSLTLFSSLHPALYSLPGNSLRIIIELAFACVGIYLLQKQGNLLEHNVSTTKN